MQWNLLHTRVEAVVSHFALEVTLGDICWVTLAIVRSKDQG